MEMRRCALSVNRMVGGVNVATCFNHCIGDFVIS